MRQPGGDLGDHRAPHDGAAHQPARRRSTSTLDDRRARPHRRDRAARHQLQLGRRRLRRRRWWPTRERDVDPGERDATATALVQDLAARGHVVGDGHSTGASGGVYAHHNPATGVLQADVPLGGAAEVDDAVTVGTRRACRRGGRCRWPSAWRSCTASPTCSRRTTTKRARSTRSTTARRSARCAPAAYTAAWTRYYAGWIDKLDGEVVPVARRRARRRASPSPTA